MKNFYSSTSLFSVLALVAFQYQSLQATSISGNTDKEGQHFQKPVKSLTSEPFDLVQNTLQKIINGQYVPDSSFEHLTNTSLEEIKQLKSTITPDHDMFDAWVKLILNTFPKHPDFEDILKVAQLKGESESATPIAQENLGYMYRFGHGVKTDLPKAVELYQKAADQGFVSAQYSLGLMYLNGQDVDQDLHKAFKLHEKAAYQGNDVAQLSLSILYLNGQGVDQDLFKAFEYCKKAAYQGNDIAQFSLGVMYQFAQGVDFNFAESLKWYLVSLKRKNPNINTNNNFKIIVNILITFVPSTIMLEDEKNLVNNQETLINNIEVFLGLHGMEKGINASYDTEKGADKLNLSFKESKFAIPSLFKNYSEIVDFEDILLKVIHASDQSDVEAFKSSNCPDIKYHEFQGQSFLTFGQSNVKTADKLMTIFDTAQPAYSAISYILGALTEIQKSFEAEIAMSDL